MSTPCMIGIKTEEGYKAIYCHFDGYHSNMWPMLTENYNSEELATKLVNLGSASSIEPKLEPTPGTPHTFDFPEKEVSVFYHRDRGESWERNKPKIYKSKKELRSQFGIAYVWENGKWEEL